ncbi:MAG TPA: heterodisulfide reductase-related iron-sulfur binding cluster [Jatrophihabitans sp.]|jgi:Fe-S oxidoreductase|nr:heterodisulfide reductase-related iron-sulfur binding cluster [Jatrophihabitans sp.]
MAGATSTQPYDYRQFFNDMSDSERLQVSRHELEWIKRHTPAGRTAEVVLALSCGAQTTPYVMLTQVAVFKALGIDFAATAGQAYCCGNIFDITGKPEQSYRTASSSVRRFADFAPAVNVQCCGSCYVKFDDHVRAMESAEPGSAPFEVVQISQFLLQVLREMGERVPWLNTIPRRVLVHAEGDELKRGKSAARQAIVDTLELIPGVEFVGLVEDPSLGTPCRRIPSADGPVKWMLEDIGPAEYRQVQAELEAQARAVRADVIVTPHHSCHREWCKFGSDRLAIMYYQSLVAEALGIHVPDRFQILWRTGDPDKILELTRPHWESWSIPEPAAREMVKKFFVPEYAAAVDKCPCEGNCFQTRLDSAALAD